MLDFDDITLIPRVVSDVEHRYNIDTSVEFCGVHLGVPIISAPMPDVGSAKLCFHMADAGGLGIIHRFQDIEDQVKQLREFREYYRDHKPSFKIACALGLQDLDERFNALYDTGCKIVCVDTANGCNTRVFRACEKLRKYGNIKIIAGNVASVECFNELANYCDAIRCGIAGGKVCTTRIETGIHSPMISLLMEIWDKRTNFDCKIIADGGIREPRDMCKALIWADAVMAGSLFAGCKESPSKTIKLDEKVFKVYRGAASYSTQTDAGKTPNYVEGKESLIPYSGKVSEVVSRFARGLQSCMSYMNSNNLKEYKTNVSWDVVH